MELISKSSVDVVIVTYGERWGFLKPILAKLEGFDEINSIILVDNGVPYDLNVKLKEFNKIKTVHFQNNEGSATGFNAGINKALQGEGNFIWLLDDDNLPNDDALEKLKKMQVELNDEKVILSSFRNDRLELLNSGGQSFTRNSFFEFNILKKVFKKSKRYSKKDTGYPNLLACEAVPYGGLFLNKTIMEQVDLPTKEYYLYCDDIDFTYRMTNQGYSIYCVTDSVIVDLESSWYRKEKVPMFQGIFRTNELTRGLYSIRNRVYFEKNYIADSIVAYYVNIFIYMCFVLIKYMPKNVNGLKRYIILWKAINKGRKGVLGKEKSW